MDGQERAVGLHTMVLKKTTKTPISKPMTNAVFIFHNYRLAKMYSSLLSNQKVPENFVICYLFPFLYF